MADRQVPEDFGSKLLEQDKSLDTPRYEEHRMQLERQLARAESRERLAKRVVIAALLVAAAVFPILASRVFGSPDPLDKEATVLSIAAGLLYTLAWVTVFVGVASYYSRFLPRVRRAREELQAETIRELRRDISELHQLLAGTAQARKTDQSGPAE